MNRLQPMRWFAFAAALCISAEALAQNSQLDKAMVRAGSPPELASLKALALPPSLDLAAARDVRDYPAAEAAARIRDRLRLNSVSIGFVPTEQAAQSAANASGGRSPKVQVDSEAAKVWRKSLGLVAVSPTFDIKALGLERIAPDALVEAQTRAIYGSLFQLNPGTPTGNGLPTGQRDLPTGVVPAQTLPGVPEEALTDCDKRFEDIKNSCGPATNGQRCERFSRRAFSEVARITTPDGGVCSGTVIHPRWVLSAAHCFLKSESSKEFAAKFADRATPSGDALLKGGDLGKTQLHLDHTARTDSRRDIEFVVVNKSWHPTQVIEQGRVVRIEDVKVTADIVFPGDMALIHLSEKDAAEADVRPAILGSTAYRGVITTAGYGVSTVGDGNPGTLWVTWPEPGVEGVRDQLELKLTPGDGGGTESMLVSTFCVGDSGGPAYAQRHRGCQQTASFERPRELVGITSYYWGRRGASNSPTAAKFCEASPVMRFVSVASPINHEWICAATGRQGAGC